VPPLIENQTLGNNVNRPTGQKHAWREAGRLDLFVVTCRYWLMCGSLGCRRRIGADAEITENDRRNLMPAPMQKHHLLN
jgi:hypothetical protein